MKPAAVLVPAADLPRLARLLAPLAPRLNARFLAGLKPCHDVARRKALAALTASAAARVMADGRPLEQFCQAAAYHGRRLAKLNVSPEEVIECLEAHDRLAEGELGVEWRSALQGLRLAVVNLLHAAFYEVREMETQAFYGLFRAEVEARGLEDLLRRQLRVLARFCRARAGRLSLTEAHPVPAELKRALARPRYIASRATASRLILDDGLRRRYASWWSIPFYWRGQLRAVLQLGFATPYRWLPRELALLEAAAERCLAAVERARLVRNLSTREEQVRSLGAHVMQVEEAERRRLSRELHDETGQSLMFLRMQLERLEKQGPEDMRAPLAETREVAERVITEIRRAIAALSPAVLEQLGLPAAIRQLTARLRKLYPLRVRLRIALPAGRLPPPVETLAYRLVQECYHNIARHSEACHVNLFLGLADGSVELRVADDGVGFVPETAFGQERSFGLAGMRERVTLLGGSMRVRAAPGHGCRLDFRLPLSGLAATQPGSSYAQNSHPVGR